MTHMYMNIRLKMMQDTVQRGFKNPYFIGLRVYDKLMIIIIMSTSKCTCISDPLLVDLKIHISFHYAYAYYSSVPLCTGIIKFL